jgi:mannosyl-oligosaccharide alpha-1,2-mannosidase
MEYKYLAHLTGRKEYFAIPDHIMDIMKESQSKNGLWATRWDTMKGTQIGPQYSVGGEADSAYEYLLKQYLMTSKSEPKMLNMYLKAIDGALENLLFLSPTRNLLYVTDMYGDSATSKLEHLSCFFPGLLALGAHTLDLPPDVAQIHKWAAEGLATTCWLMYADQETGIGPEAVSFQKWRPTNGASPANDKANGQPVINSQNGKWMDIVRDWARNGKVGGVPPGVRGGKPMKGAEGQKDYSFQDSRYILRPETIESIFLLWRTTGDPVWRERGWEIYQGIEKYTKTKHGYASLQNVAKPRGSKLNEQPSYFFAETLKYLFLLFSDESVLPLDKFVLNTEAHPLPIFEWSAWERRRFNISHTS